MKADLADKESLEAKRAQQEEESRENCKLISEHKAVREHKRVTSTYDLQIHSKFQDLHSDKMA